MHNILKEPFFHFLLAGTLLFVAYEWLNTGQKDQPNEERMVRITAGQVEWLKQTWARQWGRPPLDAEVREIVAGYLKEELLAREAYELKLDEHDIVVRRRLAQKMEFLVQDTTQVVEPGEDELRRFYTSHPERFQAPARITFTHIFFNRDKRGMRAEAEAREALEQLSHHPTERAGAFGDRFLSQYDFFETEEQAVSTVFGPEFARRVFMVEAGEWQGPIESGYGLHLVRVTKNEPARLPDFASVRNKVLTLWRQQREVEGREQYLAALMKKYNVVLDEKIKSLVGPLALWKEQER